MTEEQLKRLAERMTFRPFHYERVRWDHPNYEKFKEEEAKLTSGTVVRYQDGNLELLGDVNTSLGQCDCCAFHNPGDITEIAHLRELLFSEDNDAE